MAALNRYLVALGAAPGGTPTGNGPVPVEPWRLSPDRVDALRGELPPEITNAERGNDWLRDQGIRPASAAHAEMKVAFIYGGQPRQSGNPNTPPL